MSNAAEAIGNYFNMWNETDGEKRMSIIRSLWTDEGVFVDPIAHVRGHQEIEGMVAKVQADYPGHWFSIAGEITEHNDRAHFRWEMKDTDQEVQLAGLDCIRLEESQIADLSGFWL